jgi:hypothetical protein
MHEVEKIWEFDAQRYVVPLQVYSLLDKNHTLFSTDDEWTVAFELLCCP